jgi:hypothetical protein
MGYGERAHWPSEVDRIIIEGRGFAEVALFMPRARLLILTDLIVNLERPKLPLVFRPLARLAGVLAPDGKVPIYLRALIKMKRSQAREAAERLIATQPDLVVFTHGQWFDSDAQKRLRKSLE